MPIRAREEKKGLRDTTLFVSAFLVLFLDQSTKWFFSTHCQLDVSIPVIEGFFNLTLVRNTGTAFGFFKEARVFLIGTTVFSILFILGLYLWRRRGTCGQARLQSGGQGFLWNAALGLVLGGALGNLIDRIYRGYVIDFLDFYIQSHHWPAFNVADSAITVGAFLLVVCLWERSMFKSQNSKP